MPVTRDVLEAIHQRRSGPNPGSDLFATVDSFTRTAAEISAGVTPVNYAYAPGPKIDVRRHLSAWNDGSDQTSGLQTAINLAYANKGRLILPNGLDIASGALSLTMSGNRSNQGFAIEGPGWNAAKITQTGSPGALITINGATPTASPSEAPLVLEGFSLQGVGKNAHGVKLNGVAYWFMRGMQLRGFDRGIYLSSALVGLVDGCMSNENNYGLSAETNGAGSACNRITARDSIFNLNTTFGVHLASGTNWLLQGLDIESNGTAGNLNTGGLRILPSISAEIGYAIVGMDGCWFENNLGQPMLVDNTSGLYLAIKNTLLLSGEGHRELLIVNAANVSIENSFSPGGGGDVWDITCGEAFLKNVIVTTLSDTGITTPTYVNVRTAAGLQSSGRKDTATLTLTGVSGTVTVTGVIWQQGDDIELILPDFLGTSTSTACTITGLPAKYAPSVARFFGAVVEDNGADNIEQLNVAAGGTITLYKGGSPTGFTASGPKGLRETNLRWRL